MKTTRAVRGASLPTTFAALNALHPLRPVRAAVDYDNAVEMLDRLAVLVSYDSHFGRVAGLRLWPGQ
jgi:hypothetical protein